MKTTFTSIAVSALLAFFTQSALAESPSEIKKTPTEKKESAEKNKGTNSTKHHGHDHGTHSHGQQHKH